MFTPDDNRDEANNIEVSVMPMYDYRPKCGHLNSLILSFDEFDEFKGGDCKECGKPYNKDDREIGSVTAKVIGFAKGDIVRGSW